MAALEIALLVVLVLLIAAVIWWRRTPALTAAYLAKSVSPATLAAAARLAATVPPATLAAAAHLVAAAPPEVLAAAAHIAAVAPRAEQSAAAHLAAVEPHATLVEAAHLAADPKPESAAESAAAPTAARQLAASVHASTLAAAASIAASVPPKALPAAVKLAAAVHPAVLAAAHPAVLAAAVHLAASVPPATLTAAAEAAAKKAVSADCRGVGATSEACQVAARQAALVADCQGDAACLRAGALCTPVIRAIRSSPQAAHKLPVAQIQACARAVGQMDPAFFAKKLAPMSPYACMPSPAFAAMTSATADAASQLIPYAAQVSSELPLCPADEPAAAWPQAARADLAKLRTEPGREVSALAACAGNAACSAALAACRQTNPARNTPAGVAACAAAIQRVPPKFVARELARLAPRAACIPADVSGQRARAVDVAGALAPLVSYAGRVATALPACPGGPGETARLMGAIGSAAHRVPAAWRAWSGGE